MVFIGIFIASIVNLFIVGNHGFYNFNSWCFVFTGLTAYHMQQLKAVSHDTVNMSPEQRSKLSLIGGLQLYILFVNLFLSLLRLLGGRD